MESIIFALAAVSGGDSFTEDGEGSNQMEWKLLNESTELE